MGLSKAIELDNGIAVNYHRVVSHNTIVNVQNVIEVASYTSKAKRDEEKKAISTGAEHNVFINTKYYCTNYDSAMSDETAYNWIKQHPDFDGAEDVFEV